MERNAHDIALRDVAYTLARRRAHAPVRTAVPAADLRELATALREVAEGDLPYQPAVGNDDRGPVWVFSGQGSQWAGMGVELLAGEPVFAATIAQMEPLIAQESGFSVTEAMTAAETVTGIDRVQPTIFAMQVALAATMKSYGVVPGAVIGHSLGEVAAAVVAGALSLEDGVRVICRRSRLCLALAGGGAMASVELPAQQVLSQLAERGINDVVVAVVASPTSTVIGGATETVRELVAGWEQREIMAREVAVDVASHSPQVDPILDELIDVLADLDPATPTIPYYSATSIDPREEPYCDADYWVDNLRQMVRFGAAVQAALEDGFRVFAELSPHPLLIRAVEQTALGLETPVAALAGMRRQQPLPHGMRGLLADLHAAGSAVDFSVLYPAGHLVDAPLPSWTHRQLILTPQGSSDPRRQYGVRCIHCWARTSACRRSPSATCGRPRSARRRRRGWPITRSTACLPFPGPPTARWRWPPPAPFSARHPKSVTSASSRCCCWMPRPPSELPRLWRRRPSPASRWRPTKTAPTCGGPLRSCMSPTTNYRPPAHDLNALQAAHPDPDRRSRTARVVRQARYPIRSGVHRSGRGAHRRRVGSARCWPRSAYPARFARSRARSACIPHCWTPASSPSPPIPALGTSASGGLLLPLGVRQLRVYGPTRDARYCYARVTASAYRSGRRPRRGRRARHGPADRARAADGHRSVGEQQPRSAARRKPADHRVAAPSAARGGR